MRYATDLIVQLEPQTSVAIAPVVEFADEMRKRVIDLVQPNPSHLPDEWPGRRVGTGTRIMDPSIDLNTRLYHMHQ